MAGPDGNLWFTETSANKIGRITVNGMLTEFSLSPSSCGPGVIAAGPDGNLWYTRGCPGFLGAAHPVPAVSVIGRITTQGVSEEFPASGRPADITAGRDGSIWFTELDAGQIGRISTAGGITEYTIPTDFSEPFGIVAGPDGSLWFTESFGAKVGRISTSGNLAEFPLPSSPPHRRRS